MPYIRSLFIVLILHLYSPSIFATNYLDDAKIYLSNGKNKAAIIQLKNHLNDDPKNIDARYLLGMTYLKTGKLLLAEKELGRASLSAPENEEIQLNYAHVLLSLQKYKQITAILKHKYTKPEFEYLRLELLAYAQLGLNKVTQAQSLFQLAVSEGYNKANSGLAIIAFNDNNFSKAQLLINKVLVEDKNDKRALELKAKTLNKLEHYEEALLVYHRLIKHNPQQQFYYLQRAATYLALKQYTKAENDINFILKINKYQPHANYLLARLKLIEQKYNQAQEAAMKVVSIMPKHSPSILILGIIHNKLNNFNQAEKYLIEYLSLRPNNNNVQLLLAEIYLANNKPEEAILLLNNLRKTIDDKGNVLMLLGSAHLALKDHARGFEMLYKARAQAPQNNSIQERLIGEQIRAGDINSAIKELESKSFIDKDTLKNNSILIGSYIVQGQYKKAEEKLKQTMLTYPDAPNLYIFQAAIENYRLNYEKEKEAYNQALKIDKEFIPAYMGLGKLNYDEGNIEQAKKYYQLVITIKKNYLAAWNALAVISEKEGDIQTAEKLLLSAYTKSRGDLKNEVKQALFLFHFYTRHNLKTEIQQIADELLKNNPNSIEALSYMLNTQLSLSNLAGAEVLLNKIIHKAPQNINYRVALAQLLAQQDDRVEDMNQVLDEAFYTDPKTPYVLTVKAALQLQNGDYQGAMKTAKWTKLRFPLLNTGEILEGDVLLQMQRYDQALQVYNKAYKKEASNSLAIKIARVMTIKGSQNKALNFLTQEVKTQENNIALLFQLAKTYQNQADYKQAIKYYQQLLKQQPDNITVLNNIAWNYFQIKDPKAQEFAQKAFKKQPGSAAIADTYGTILLAEKKNKQALSILKHASELAPDIKEISFHLAQGYHANEDIANAIYILEKILSDNKPFRSKELAKKLLAQLKQ